MKSNRECVRWLSILVAASVVAGCGGSDDPGTPGVDAPPPPPPDAPAPPPPADAPIDPTPQRGQVRVVHAAPLAAALDIYVQGQTTPLASALAYGKATAAISLAPGAYTLEAREAGAPAAAPAIYTSAPIEVAVDRTTTAVAAGFLNATAPEETKFRITGVRDAFGAATPGKARVRVVHDSYSIPGVAVDVGDDGALEVAMLERFAASAAAGLEIAAGADATLAVINTTTGAKQGEFVVPAALLADGAELYAIITGLVTFRPRAPSGLVVTLVPATGATVTVRQKPVVYLVAASPDAAAIDAYGGTTKLFENLAFGKIGLRRFAPTAAAAGYTLDIRLTGADPASPALASLDTGPLAPGEQYLAVLHGLVGASAPADALALHVYRDELQLATDGNGRIRNVHAALGVSAIDVGRYTSGSAPAYVEIPGFTAIAPAAASAPEGTTVLNGTSAVPINPAVRDSAQPSSVALRFGSAALATTDRFFGVFAGAWAPAGTQTGPRYIVVKTNAAVWTTTLLSPLAPPPPSVRARTTPTRAPRLR